jgi:putative transposase
MLGCSHAAMFVLGSEGRGATMPFWQLYYHVVFATHERRPILTAALRQSANRLITRKAHDLGCILHAVHAQPDHVHLALSIAPSRAVAAIIGQIKGNSSRILAATCPADVVFGWQADYGVLSFGQRHLADVVRYVHEQDRRHATNDLWEQLERVAGDPVGQASKPIPVPAHNSSSPVDGAFRS